MLSTRNLTPVPHYVIGCDMGGTNFRMGAVESDGTVLHAQIVSSRTFLHAADPTQALTASLFAFISEIGAPPEGVCIGFPGTVSHDKSTVTSCPNLSVFDGVNIGGLLQQAFHCPVFVEHETILLLSNDLKMFELAGEDCVVAVYLGTGLGNALYIHGRFLEGKNASAGELGHIPLGGYNKVCPCGNIGCIELLASGKRLEEIQEAYFPQVSFEEMLRLHAKHPIIQKFIDYVAIAIAAEINLLDPNHILLGGGVLALESFPYEYLLEKIRLHTRKPCPERNLSFIRIPKDVHQGIRGAGIYCWKKLSASIS